MKLEWYYGDPNEEKWVGPLPLQEIKRLVKTKKLPESTHVASNIMLKSREEGYGIPYFMAADPYLDFSPDIDNFLGDRIDSPTTVLSGQNNCGKTLLLKQIWITIGEFAYLLSVNRFSTIDELHANQGTQGNQNNFYDNFVQQYSSSKMNTENNEIQLPQILVTLSDKRRETLFTLFHKMLGIKINLKQTDEANIFSSRYVDIDGENLRVGSTGTRLLITLLGLMLDERFSTILVDEPEISLSPRLQIQLSNIIFDKYVRNEYFPHLKNVFVATHSHLFLDRNTMSNNFALTREKDLVTIQQIESVNDFHHLQFNMLGNSFESIFLPSVIILVEGVSDVTFISKTMRIKFSDKKIAVVESGGDGRILDRINFIKSTFDNEMSRSPYKNRLLILLDKTHTVRKDRIIAAGIPEENLFILLKNGIEYYYPQRIMCEVFSCTESELANVQTDSNEVFYKDIRISKKKLAEKVVEKLSHDDVVDDEIQSIISFIETITQ